MRPAAVPARIPGGIVDSHLHLWDLGRFAYPWLSDPDCADLRADYLPADWRADAQAVDIAATVHVQAEIDHAVDPVEETAWLDSLAAAGGADGAPVPTVCVGYADLRAPDLDDVLDRHQRYPLFRGIRQEAWYDPYSTRADLPRHNLLDDPAWVAGLRRLAARQLTFDLLVWPHQLVRAAEIFRELPQLPVVLEHAGLPPPDPGYREQWRDGMRWFAAQVPWAVLKLSALRSVSPTWSVVELRPVVREAIEIFGPSRCMFGSNFPVDRSLPAGKPAVAYADLWRAYQEMTSDLSAAERAAIFREAAVRAYRIDLPPSVSNRCGSPRDQAGDRHG